MLLSLAYIKEIVLDITTSVVMAFLIIVIKI